MTAPELMPDCPTEETLAAFADDQLTPEQRQAVIEHLVTCGDCRELVMLAAVVKAELSPNVVPFPRRRWVAAAGVAAAAVIVLSFTLPGLLARRDMNRLVKASASLAERPTDGRFAADFPYLKPPKRNRGAGDSEGLENGSNAGVLGVASDTNDPHVIGVALLLAGEREHFGEAIIFLQQAQSKAKGDTRDAVDLDLAAALIARGTSEDLIAAFALSDGVWRRKHLPAAAWNRAAAIELRSPADDARAVQAWKDYLSVDSTSKWADEARQEITKLEDPNY